MTVGFFSDGGPFTYCRATFHSITYSVSESFLVAVTPAVTIWGSAVYGVAQWEIVWPRFTAPGVWRTSTLECYSAPSWVRYRVTDSGSATLLDPGNSTLNQTGPGDILPPSLTAVTIDRPTVYTLGSVAQHTLIVDISFVDGFIDIAGLVNITLRLTSPIGTSLELKWPASGALVAGSPTNGTVRFALDFGGAASQQLGVYLVDRLIIRDGTGLDDCLQWTGCVFGQSLAITR